MHQANTLSYATEQSGYVVVPPNTNGMLPKFFRLTSIARFPARNGKGVWNEATVHYDTATLNVGWPSATVDIRLTRGSIVTIQFDRRRMALPDRFSVKKIQLIDEPVAGNVSTVCRHLALSLFPPMPRGPRCSSNYTRVIRRGQVADRKPSSTC